MAIGIGSTAQSSSSGSVNSHTLSFNNVAGDFMFVTFCEDTGSPSQTGVTYNGVALTALTTLGSPFANNKMGWILRSPATGTHDLVATRSSTSTAVIRICVATYTGTDTSSQPDSQNTFDVTASSGSATTTVVDSDCWLIMSYGNDGGTGNDVSAGASTTLRIANAGNGAIAILDSNGAVGTGSQFLNYSTAISNEHFGNIISLSPADAPTTDIKTVDGLAIADVKTVDGLAIASVKNINGLA